MSFVFFSAVRMDDRRCRTKKKKRRERERTSDEEMKEIEKREKERERERKERGSCKESIYAIAHFVNNFHKHTHTDIYSVENPDYPHRYAH